MKHSRIFLTSLFLMTFCTQTTFAQALPTKIKNYLNKNYSGWKIGGYDKACYETKQFMITGDFNGDRKSDYAVKFNKGSKGYIFAFVAQGNDYKAHLLEKGSAKGINSTVLGIERKGEKYPIGGDIPDLIYGRLLNDAPYTIPCESDAVGFYVYKNGRFN